MKVGQPAPEPSGVASARSAAIAPAATMSAAAMPAAAMPAAQSVQPPIGMGVNRLVNMNLPNYANSPNLRKFVDSLPGLGISPGESPRDIHPCCRAGHQYLSGIRLLRDRLVGYTREDALRPAPDQAAGLCPGESVGTQTPRIWARHRARGDGRCASSSSTSSPRRRRQSLPAGGHDGHGRRMGPQGHAVTRG